MPQITDFSTYALLPQPVTLRPGEGHFSLTEATVIVVERETRSIGQLLADALARASGFSLPLVTYRTTQETAIVLVVDAALTHLGKEGYMLTVDEQAVTIVGADLAGVFYGTQTLRQLFAPAIFSAEPVKQQWDIAAVTIEDAPRFPWRGMLLDTARHFFPPVEILKLIDLLALHKINVLHLHITDDQGWRMESKRYPRLTEVGAWRKETVIGHALKPEGYDGTPHGGFYRQEELREMVAYAQERFVTIVPELDMPGHARAALAAYPELGVSGQPLEVATTWGIFPDLYSPTAHTLHFLQDVLTEIMEIFPAPVIHVGGDEAIKDQWQASPAVQARIKALGLADEQELQSWFLSQIGTFLHQHGRRFIGWDEILEGGLPEGALVMSWRGLEGGLAAARAGHDVVMTPQAYVYLDHYQSNDPAEPLAIGGYTPLEKIYSFDPLPAALTPEQARHILGAQANLWSEYITTPAHLEYMAFPRLIALAELTWTPQAQRDFADFRQRLARHEERLRHLQVHFRAVATWEKESTFPARGAVQRAEA
jgi:hexosaminidase